MNSPKDRVSATEDNIKVFCRFRPLNNSEKRARSKVIVNFPAGHNGNCVSAGEKSYLFDKVFKPNATQAQVYNDAAKSIVTDVLAGYNGTIFAYGQTSSGKTHTMEGVIGDAHAQGIIPRIGHDIFNHIHAMEANLEFQIKVSYFEIYMNKIRDLLDVSRVNLGVHEDKNGAPFVRGTTERFVSSPEEIFKIIEVGRSNRQIALTSMNEHSSRSHSIFLINVKRKDTNTQKKSSGKLYLVDLAGFEKVSKTGADGTILDEAKNINKSLSALRNVISALTDTNKSHIPYRDSILTRILQESLGGNAKTTIIICCSPASLNESETKSTLQFGNRVKTINNVACVNEELSVTECNRRYQREKDKVVRFKSIIEKLQWELSRWRQGETVSLEEQLSFDDGFEVNTTITTTVSRNNESVMTIPDNEFVIRLLSNGDRKKLKEERARFSQQLNEKNEEINRQVNNLAKLEKQMEEREKLIGTVYKDCEQLHEEINIINRKTESAKNKAKGVLQRLSKLTINHDKKLQDIEIEKKEHKILSEIQITDDMLFTSVTSWPGFEKDKSEKNNLITHCPGPETFHTNCNKTLSEYKNELSECQLFIPQHNSTCEQTRSESLSETGTPPCAWEPVSCINYEIQIECAELTTAQEVQRNSEITELKETVSKMHVTLEEQMGQLRNSHLQIAVLRNEISEKQEIINELKDLNQKFVLALEHIQADYEQLKQVEGENSDKLQKLIRRNKEQEEICNDSQDRTEESSIPDDIMDTADNGGFLLKKQKILFLENNLEQLTKIHIQLLQDDVRLRCELPKLHMRLRASRERVETLESALRDAREDAMWERKRYQFIVHRVEENSRNNNSNRQRSIAQISKPECIEHDIQTNDNGCVIS